MSSVDNGNASNIEETTAGQKRKIEDGDQDAVETKQSSVYENTNGMPMAGGKNLHMEIMPGQLANRVRSKIIDYLHCHEKKLKQMIFCT